MLLFLYTNVMEVFTNSQRLLSISKFQFGGRVTNLEPLQKLYMSIKQEQAEFWKLHPSVIKLRTCLNLLELAPRLLEELMKESQFDSVSNFLFLINFLFCPVEERPGQRQFLFYPAATFSTSVSLSTSKRRLYLAGDEGKPAVSLPNGRRCYCSNLKSEGKHAINQTSVSSSPHHHPSSISYHSAAAAAGATHPILFGSSISAKDVAFAFKEWFKSRNDVVLDRVFQILRGQGKEDETVLVVSQLGIRLSEKLVINALNYGRSNYDVLTCIKFFDWAGHQHGFHHTRGTYHSLFKILAKSRNMSTMFDFLNVCSRDRMFLKQTAFQSILVMGYAVAGKPLIALQVFGRMRFQGLDLDSFTYHLLLNSLVEEGSSFDAVSVISEQISARGFEQDVTHTIVVKSLCRQNMLDDAEAYLREILLVDDGHAVSVLVDALCRGGRFDKAGKLLEEFKELGVRPMEPAYGVWLKDLVQAGNVDGALEFLQSKKSLEGYVPEIFRYNYLLDRLLKENRLGDAYDLLIEMRDGGIVPDRCTMNAALCFFCKAGMVGVALELYNSRSDLAFSPNTMAYNYLINSLCGDGSVDEAYHVLKNWTEQHGSAPPGKRTFYILADTLSREGKLDKMKDLVLMALERNFTPSICEKFISAMCRAERVEDGYLIHGELSRLNKDVRQSTYTRLIHGFSRSNGGDIAARLLIEMQEKGHRPNKNSFKSVICCLCNMENANEQVLKLLDMQLPLEEHNCNIYNIFIDAAGSGGRPDLAREVYEMMLRNGIEPNIKSYTYLLRSYLLNCRVPEAVSFFDALDQRIKARKTLYCVMVINLAKLDKLNLAFRYLNEMRNPTELHPYGIIPSIECWEVLVQKLCDVAKYDLAVKLIYDLEKLGRRVTSYIGNRLLYHSLKGVELHQAWDRYRLTEVQDESDTSKKLSLFCNIVGVFSGCVSVRDEIDDLEELIAQCFPLNIYTFNMMLRRLCMHDVEKACDYFAKLHRQGYEPNRWTYDIIVHGFLKEGKRQQARIWMTEMFQQGFCLTESTDELLRTMTGMQAEAFGYSVDLPRDRGRVSTQMTKPRTTMPFEIMTGDCPKCGNVNFSIGTFCDTGKCNTPTPESQILCSCNCKLHNLAKIQVFFN
ncbi:Pentatricopeptide repeat-containing protein At1g71210, mitochondrial [Linum perenne]